MTNGRRKCVFVTGGTGFAGSYLVDSLLDEGCQVTGLVHQATSHQPLPEHSYFSPVEGDLLDVSSLTQAMEECQPDVVYHLAGQASPGLSWKNPALTLAVNAGGTANILEAARVCGKPRVVVITSAQIYENSPDLVYPITEGMTPNPSHPYGISKWAAGQLVSLYWKRYQLPAIEARPFNHIGPRQALGYVVPDFASQIASIRLGSHEPIISVGNLAAKRDFTDVRDVVRAYKLLAEKGRAGESYLICSGKTVSIQTLLDTLIEVAGVDVEVNVDPKRVRPLEQEQVFGSFAKIERDTGWRPEITLIQSLKESFYEWLSKSTHE